MTGIAPTIATLFPSGLPLRLTAYDGSSAGPADSPYTIELTSPRALSYILTAPGDLGLGRAYVAGDIALHGAHPGNPYEPFSLLKNHTDFGLPLPSQAIALVRALGLRNLVPPAPPPQEHLPAWRHRLEGLRAITQWSRHSKERDADAIHHHYDVSNTFYEYVLGPSMTYTCAVFPTEDATLEEAQENKYDLICRKLDLKPGQRLLDVGCGWGGMVRHAAKHYGVKALGVTLSRNQAEWATQEIKSQGLDDLAEVRFMDYRDVTETDFDAISSIGLTEHIGVKQYGEYFAFLHDHLKVGGRLLNHCITRPNNKTTNTGAFIDRYVFPDGELTGVGRITIAAQDAGLEVRHVENLREHYALTLKGWCENLVEHWDEALGEVTIGRAKVWGIYMAGSRLAFERNEIELHHVLAVKADSQGNASWPLRPTWLS
jgi:cyclopropane-fatty-acyl-phospholipid synthase